MVALVGPCIVDCAGVGVGLVLPFFPTTFYTEPVGVALAAI
jgi:hypothetical protein